MATPPRKTGASAPDAPPAYWNQDEYDRAVHLISQPRRLELDLGFLGGGHPLAGKAVRVYTRRTIFEGGDVFTDFTLDGDGGLRGPLAYDRSLVEVELPGASLPRGCGLDSVVLRWFRPGECFESLNARLDAARFSLHSARPERDGDLAFDFSFDPVFSATRFYLSFGNLLGLEFAADGKTEAAEGGAAAVGAGRARVEFRMREFFAKWNENYSRPYRVDDAYAVSGTVTLAPPLGFLSARPSARKDPPYVPRKYSGEVPHEDGNPFLDVPSTTPVEELVCRFSRNVKVTAAMLR